MQYADVFDYSNADAHKRAAMNIPLMLREILDRPNWDQGKLARRLKTSQATISRWQAGKMMPESESERRILALCRELGIINHAGGNQVPIPVVGYIGAGGQILHAEGQGPFGEAPMPPENGSPSTVAVIVQGDSMGGVLGNGSVVYYDNRQEPPTEALFGKLCVVGLADGRILLKTLLPGSRPGLFNLISLAASPIFDQTVDWAARVSFIGLA